MHKIRNIDVGISSRFLFTRFALSSLILAFFSCANGNLSNEAQILSFEISSSDSSFQVKAEINESSNEITATVPSEIGVSSLKTSISISPGAKISPESGQAVNFQGGTVFTVTAQDGTKATYFVRLEQKSSKNELLGFLIPELSLNGIITGNTVEVPFPYGVSPKEYKVEMSFSEKASSSIDSGSTINFSETNLTVTITSEIGEKKDYQIIPKRLPPSEENLLLSFKLPDLFVEADIENNTVSMEFPFGTDLSDVMVEYEVSDYAIALFENKSSINLSELEGIVITAQSGRAKLYELDIKYLPQETGIRGVWLTNVASDVLTSREKIAEAMELLSDLNFNTVFVVTWNKTQTPHPSRVLREVVEPLDIPESSLRFDPSRDILQEVIEEAHKRDLKVIAWFEYGFASQYGNANGGKNWVLQANPHWASQDLGGNIANKNNFYWMNAFHPEVQQFMTDLILEVVENYQVDGIQGDDRLPAVSSTSGYDAYTIDLFRSQNNGNEPPNSIGNNQWIDWRADILNEYAQDLYNQVKETNPKCLVSFSPSPFAFSLNEYCQDWPDWLERGIVDILSVQLYRRDRRGINTYKQLFNTNLAYAKNNLKVFYPGVLLRIDSYVPSDQYLVDLIRFHREKQVMGEVFFFYEGVRPKQKVFQAIYPGKALFPSHLLP